MHLRVIFEVITHIERSTAGMKVSVHITTSREQRDLETEL